MSRHGCSYVLLAGLPGTGKSTVANKLVKRLEPSVILNKDIVRAALFPGAATDYSDAQNDLCLEAMLSSADYLRTSMRFIFFDGRTFSRATHIDRIVEAAKSGGVAWSILHLWCADDIAIGRLATENAGHPARNRDAALYMALKGRFEVIERPHLSIDTGQPLIDSVEACLHYLENSSP